MEVKPLGKLGVEDEYNFYLGGLISSSSKSLGDLISYFSTSSPINQAFFRGLASRSALRIYIFDLV